MGLNEKISEEDGVTATSKENGIDVHMMLPTEYGAIAILSASGYGNSGKLRNEPDAQKRTTTGNATGVYFTGDRGEILPCGTDLDDAKYWKSTETEVDNNRMFGGDIWGWHNGTWENFDAGSASGDYSCLPGYLVVGSTGLFGGGYLLTRAFNPLRGGDGFKSSWDLHTWGQERVAAPIVMDLVDRACRGCVTMTS